MPRALNLLRASLHYRRDAFSDGLRAAGFEVVDSLHKPGPGDLVLTWNRYGGSAEQAWHFERNGAGVLVAENSPFGDMLPGRHYSLARSHVAMTGGAIPEGGPERWASMGVPLAPWRTVGTEAVILGQRSIGHPDVASPRGWAEVVQRRTGGRIRQHPGTGPAVPLDEDLRNAAAVVTWSSAAAVQALALGVPVWHAHPRFFGAMASQPLTAWGRVEALRDDALRLDVFRRLAWGVWSLDEIRAGEAIRCALQA